MRSAQVIGSRARGGRFQWLPKFDKSRKSDSYSKAASKEMVYFSKLLAGFLLANAKAFRRPSLSTSGGGISAVLEPPVGRETAHGTGMASCRGRARRYSDHGEQLGLSSHLLLDSMH